LFLQKDVSAWFSSMESSNLFDLLVPMRSIGSVVLVLAMTLFFMSSSVKALAVKMWPFRMSTDNIAKQLFEQVPPTASKVHVVVLVHGYMGNALELGYLQTTLKQKAARIQEESPGSYFLVHSSTTNEGRTSDGIAAGGSRVAREVNEILANLSKENSKREISLSFVGNSLGGLYARYALSEIPSLAAAPNDTEKYPGVQPKVFCTTATPHLGVSEHTYLPIPRVAEYVVAKAMSVTGEDMFRFTSIMERLACDPIFCNPLRSFQTRLAYANAHQTDFQVPTATAAFLVDSKKDANHRRVESNTRPPFELLRVETVRRESTPAPSLSTSNPLSSSDLARHLDDMGWIKVFCDVRQHLWSARVPSLLWSSSSSVSTSTSCQDDKDEECFTSGELLLRYGSTVDQRWHAPFGHTQMVANSKNSMYSKMNAGGRPIMDQLASDILQSITMDHSSSSCSTGETLTTK
jgi:pimeloyl-ACP methyl ester carboxylesterase